MQNYNSYPGVTYTGIVAPFHDMWRNYKTMRDEQKWTGGDNFFHCKANYEAAKRGRWGEIVSKAISAGREAYGILKGEKYGKFYQTNNIRATSGAAERPETGGK